MAEIDDFEEIARNPQADVPRWRAAAWYERQGDFDQAAFIRMQLQLARLPNGVDSPEWLPLIEESERLLAKHYGAWTAPYRDLGIVYAGYDRGFIESVGVPAMIVVDDEQRKALLRRLPIRHIDITSLGSHSLVDVLHVPDIASMVSLGFDNLGLEDHHASAFATRLLPSLRWLSLTRNMFTAEGVNRLAALSPRWLPELTVVDLAGNPYDPMSEVEYDQHVALTWRRGADHGETLPAPWLAPNIVDGRVEPVDRLALARPPRTSTDEREETPEG